MFTFRITMTFLKVLLFVAITLLCVDGFENEISTDTSIAKRPQFELYTKKSNKFIIDANTSLSKSPFILQKPLKLIVLGTEYMEPVETLEIQSLVNEYLIKYDCNVIVYYWSFLTVAYVNDPFERDITVANYVTNLLDALQDTGYNMSSVHIIGYGTGAHLAGFAARNTKEEVARVTGLDPTYRKMEDIMLNRYQAKFVDAIYTSQMFGNWDHNVAHAIFVVNGGLAQPGCDNNDQCNQKRSLLYFIESIRESKFPAQKYNEPDGEEYIMGDGTNTTERGLFSLKTNNEKPFGELNVGFRLLKIKH